MQRTANPSHGGLNPSLTSKYLWRHSLPARIPVFHTGGTGAAPVGAIILLTRATLYLL